MTTPKRGRKLPEMAATRSGTLASAADIGGELPFAATAEGRARRGRRQRRAGVPPAHLADAITWAGETPALR